MSSSVRVRCAGEGCWGARCIAMLGLILILMNHGSSVGAMAFSWVGW